MNYQTCDPNIIVHHVHSQTPDRAKFTLVPIATPPVTHACTLWSQITVCLARSGWKHADWRRLVFSDESYFQLRPDDHRRRVWRRPG
ncbi:uncharacterized protein TNCV_3609731 [Trichonephila clavipes]|nr:uncharacterized protein TNCV_3609731 [Trichonephila clavipes]